MAGDAKLAGRPIEDLKEMPLLELAYSVLVEANEPFYYRDLMHKVAQLRQMSDEQVEDVIAKLYTDINIDGRFLCIGENVWGLRRWYPTERTVEKGSAKRFVRKDPMAFEEEDDSADLEEELLEDEDPLFDYGDEEEGFSEDAELSEEEMEFSEEESEIETLEVEEEEDEEEEF